MYFPILLFVILCMLRLAPFLQSMYTSMFDSKFLVQCVASKGTH